MRHRAYRPTNPPAFLASDDSGPCNADQARRIERPGTVPSSVQLGGLNARGRFPVPFNRRRRPLQPSGPDERRAGLARDLKPAKVAHVPIPVGSMTTSSPTSSLVDVAPLLAATLAGAPNFTRTYWSPAPPSHVACLLTGALAARRIARDVLDAVACINHTLAADGRGHRRETLKTVHSIGAHGPRHAWRQHSPTIECTVFGILPPHHRLTAQLRGPCPRTDRRHAVGRARLIMVRHNGRQPT